MAGYVGRKEIITDERHFMFTENSNINLEVNFELVGRVNNVGILQNSDHRNVLSTNISICKEKQKDSFQAKNMKVHEIVKIIFQIKYILSYKLYYISQFDEYEICLYEIICTIIS